MTSKLVTVVLGFAALAFLTSCNCENLVESEEVAACADSMSGLEFPENQEACDACCIGEGYDIGAPFGHVTGAVNASCDCGMVGTCDE